jgi:hypothetical protein
MEARMQEAMPRIMACSDEDKRLFVLLGAAVSVQWNQLDDRARKLLIEQAARIVLRGEPHPGVQLADRLQMLVERESGAKTD